MEQVQEHPLVPPREANGRYSGLGRLSDFFIDYAMRERTFLALLGFGFLLVGVTYEHAAIARWVGFLFASYAAVGNDSIQTIGTFIASNGKKPWWALWLFMGAIFLATVLYSWLAHDGDVSYQRLAAKGFETAPASFSYLQVAAPLFLLILTRFRMPVSTTFLLLTSFTTSAGSVGKVLSKSVSGYALAFAVAFGVWIVLSKVLERWTKGTEPHPLWRIGQWIISGVLWAVWLMQDAANIAVYLPRSLSLLEFIAFAGVIVAGLGLLFYMRGERVQQVVTEKTNVVDVRSATIIDAVYAVILFYFKMHSKMPMSTTWVFIGLLGGRELAISLRRAGPYSVKHAVKLMAKDVFFVAIGLLVSVIIATAVNDGFRSAVLGMFGL